jgi:hypothetical protein
MVSTIALMDKMKPIAYPAATEMMTFVKPIARYQAASVVMGISSADMVDVFLIPR